MRVCVRAYVRTCVRERGRGRACVCCLFISANWSRSEFSSPVSSVFQIKDCIKESKGAGNNRTFNYIISIIVKDLEKKNQKKSSKLMFINTSLVLLLSLPLFNNNNKIVITYEYNIQNTRWK